MNDVDPLGQVRQAEVKCVRVIELAIPTFFGHRHMFSDPIPPSAAVLPPVPPLRDCYCASLFLPRAPLPYSSPLPP